MSGSPKYAPVRLDPVRMAILAQERARRIEERRLRAEQRRRQAVDRQRARVAAHRAAQQHRREEVLATAAALAARVDGAPGLTAQQRAGLHAGIDEARRAVASGGVAQATARVRGVEQALDAGERRATAGSATADRVAELAIVVAESDAVEDRRRHDDQGARQVDRLVRAAQQVVHDPRRFPAAHAALVERLAEHVRTVEAARALADRAELDVGQAIGALQAVLDEAASAGIELVGSGEVERLRERTAADLTAGRAESALLGAERLVSAVTELEAQVEVVLDQLQAAELIVAAAVKALPAVGFRVVEDSVMQSGGTVAFEIARVDGAVIELQIEPSDEGVRLRYAGSASDYVIEHSSDGPVARCDLTEELLERFHDELDGEGIQAGELEWEGKPLRPVGRGAQPGQAATGNQTQG